MAEDMLRELLQRADQMMKPPGIARDWASEVSAKVQEQQRRRRLALPVAAAAAVFLTAGLLALVAHKPASQPADSAKSVPQIDPQTEIARLEQEIKALQAEVGRHREKIAGMLEREKWQRELAKQERRLAVMPDAAEEVRQQLEKAATTTLSQADRKYNQLDLKESAMADYRQIVQLYPQTQAAQQAQKRIETDKTQTKGDVL